MEEVGSVFVDGKMYEIDNLSIDELKELENILKDKEEICRRKIKSELNK